MAPNTSFDAIGRLNKALASPLVIQGTVPGNPRKGVKQTSKAYNRMGRRIPTGGYASISTSRNTDFLQMQLQQQQVSLTAAQKEILDLKEKAQFNKAAMDNVVTGAQLSAAQLAERQKIQQTTEHLKLVGELQDTVDTHFPGYSINLSPEGDLVSKTQGRLEKLVSRKIPLASQSAPGSPGGSQYHTPLVSRSNSVQNIARGLDMTAEAIQNAVAAGVRLGSQTNGQQVSAMGGMLQFMGLQAVGSGLKSVGDAVMQSKAVSKVTEKAFEASAPFIAAAPEQIAEFAGEHPFVTGGIATLAAGYAGLKAKQLAWRH